MGRGIPAVSCLRRAGRTASGAVRADGRSRLVKGVVEREELVKVLVLAVLAGAGVPVLAGASVPVCRCAGVLVYANDNDSDSDNATLIKHIDGTWFETRD